MQILKVYSIRDNKSEFYANPFYARSNGEAMRIFENACTASDSPLSAYPQDFALYELGTFNDETAKLTVLDTPNHLYNGIDAVRNKKVDEQERQKPLKLVKEK